MSDIQTLGWGAAAGFFTSVITGLATVLGFNRRIERLEQNKVSMEIQRMCSANIIARIDGLHGEVKGLREETRGLSRRIDRLVNGHERFWEREED